MTDQKNTILAIVISIAIILIFNFFFMEQPKRPAPGQQTAGSTVKAKPGQLQVPQTPGATTPGTPQTGTPPAAKPGTGRQAAPAVPGGLKKTGPGREALLRAQKRVRIETPRVKGSITLKGAKFDDLTMTDYRTELDMKSPKVTLLQPVGGANAYYAEHGWLSSTGKVKLPDANSVWTADRRVLTPEAPVTLTWDNGAGLKFVRTYAIDKNYMVTVTQKVINSGTTPVTLFPYALIQRSGTPQTSGWFVLHEGPYGVFRKNASDSGSLNEYSYENLRDDRVIKHITTGGWIGFTDRYWMAALIPDQKLGVNAAFKHFREGSLDKYQVDMVYTTGLTVAPGGGEAKLTSRVFSGAKELGVIDGYAEKLGIAQFDLAIDFGWFYFLTKPIFHLIIIIYNFVGNFGVAILILTVLIKIVFFPLANKSYRAMGKMKALSPKMQQIKERFGDNKELQNKELMELYKREKVNPMAGCWPILIQIPVFFALYKVLLVNIEMRHAPFFWWIQDLSARDPTSVLNLFGLLPFTAPTEGIIGIISIGVWPILMGISMWMQQKLNPAPPDPMQARIFMLLPIVFTFMLAPFAAGLVIYWTWNNLLSMAQQYVIMKRHGGLSQAVAPTAGGPPKKAHAKVGADGDEAEEAKPAGGKARQAAKKGQGTKAQATKTQAAKTQATKAQGGKAGAKTPGGQGRGRGRGRGKGRGRR